MVLAWFFQRSSLVRIAVAKSSTAYKLDVSFAATMRALFGYNPLMTGFPGTPADGAFATDPIMP
jgi:hypothetical protein